MKVNYSKAFARFLLVCTLLLSPGCNQRIVGQLQGQVLMAQVSQNFFYLISETTITQGSTGQVTLCIAAHNDANADPRFVNCNSKLSTFSGDAMRIIIHAKQLADLMNPGYIFDASFDARLNTSVGGQAQALSTEDNTDVIREGQVQFTDIGFAGEELATVDLDFRARLIQKGQVIADVTGYIIGDF